MAGLRCRKCVEPLPPALVCLVCEYEKTTGHRLERIPERPVLEDVELLRLFELDTDYLEESKTRVIDSNQVSDGLAA